MIGLFVARGYPLSISIKDVQLDPSVRFQRSYLDDWAKAANQSVLHSVALGIARDARIEASHPALRRAFLLSKHEGKVICVDNYARLFDNHDWDSAQAFNSAILESGYQIYSALHKKKTNDLDLPTLKALLLDRLHQQDERRACSDTRKELAEHDWIGKPRVSRSSKQQMKAVNSQSHESFVAGHIREICGTWVRDGESPPFAVSRLVDALNGRSVKTERGREWTSANLRKLLRERRQDAPDDPLFGLVKLPEPKEAS